MPLQYQAVDGASATKSGIKILPFMMSAVACSIISGAITGITGEYWYEIIRRSIPKERATELESSQVSSGPLPDDLHSHRSRATADYHGAHEYC
jgi:hypothetical protein